VFLTAGATVAIATWVGASSSQQVEQLDSLVVPRSGHVATALSDGRVLITGGRDSNGNLVAAFRNLRSGIASLHRKRIA